MTDVRREIVTAIMGFLETKEIVVEPRPTIDELEKILNSEDPMRLTIKPDGSVVELVPAKTTVGAVADIVLALITREKNAAVEQERERCAKVAAECRWSYDRYATCAPVHTFERLRVDIAAAIRSTSPQAGKEG